MADGVLPARRRRRGPAAANALRAAQGVRLRPQADRRHQQDRPARRPHRRGAQRRLRPVRRTRRRRRHARFPDHLRLGPRRASPPPTWRCRPRTCSRSSTPSSNTCRRPDVEPDAPLQMLVAALDYSEFVGRIAIGRVFAGKIRKGQQRRPAQARRQAHRRHRRAGAGVRPPRPQAKSTRSAPATSAPSSASTTSTSATPIADFDNAVALPPHHHRRADARHGVPHQRLAVRRPGRQSVDQPAAARPADEGAAVERRPARPAERGAGRRVHRLRPRPAAPVDSAGEHPPRGLASWPSASRSVITARSTA